MSQQGLAAGRQQRAVSSCGRLSALPSTLPSPAPSPAPLAGALEVIGGLGLWRAKKIVQMLAAWIEKRRDPRVQGLFTTRGVGELLFGYE